MRKNHQHYFIKKFITGLNRFYIAHFVRPQFTLLGRMPQIFSPQHLVVFGDNISVGNYAHIISSPDNKIRLTAWPSKGQSARIDIGDYCLISPGTRISAAQHIRIGNGCMFAANCYISDSDWHGIYNRTRPFRCTKPINLADNVWLGERVIICKGVSIGENSVIGAGAVVTHDIPANVVAAGNPAKVIKTINPKRRMLTRETLFRDAEHYYANMDGLDQYTLAGNSIWGWLRSVFFPNQND